MQAMQRVLRQKGQMFCCERGRQAGLACKVERNRETGAGIQIFEGHIRMPEIQVKTIIFAKGRMGLLCDQKQW